MTKISRILLKPYIKKDIIKEFWYSLDELGLKELYSFFYEVLSPTEVLMVAKRLAILRSLRKGIDYESIRETYKVTDTTIAKMNNMLQKADNDFLKALDKLVRAEQRRWEEFKEKRKKAGGVGGSGKRLLPRKI